MKLHQHLTLVHSCLLSLDQNDRDRLGVTRADGRDITYDQLDYFFVALASRLEAGWCRAHPQAEFTLPEGCVNGCGHTQTIDYRWLCDAVTDATRPTDIDLGTSKALDSTDIQTHARVISWKPLPDDQFDGLDPTPEIRVRRKGRRNPPGWPRKGPDGRAQHTKDPSAREGYSPAKNGRRSGTQHGYDFHAVVAAVPRKRPTQSVPLFIERWELVPAGTHRGQSGAGILLRAVADGLAIGDVLADRAYSTSLAEFYHRPLREAGIDIVLDLHQNQRGRQQVRPGVFSIDGTIFPEGAVPPALFEIDRPDELLAREDPAERTKLEALRAQLDYRAQFAFRRNSVNPDGSEQWIGPAYVNRSKKPTARCVNYGASLRANTKLPKTMCRPGSGCTCGATITLQSDQLEQVRQLRPWGSTAWFRDYSRRSIVEAVFSLLRYHYCHVGRHFTRVFGTTKNSLLLLGAVVALNIESLESYRRQHLRAQAGAQCNEATSQREQSA